MKMLPPKDGRNYMHAIGDQVSITILSRSQEHGK